MKIGSRSTAVYNVDVWRHELMFQGDGYDDFTGDLEQYKDTERDAYLVFRRTKLRHDNTGIVATLIDLRAREEATKGEQTNTGPTQRAVYNAVLVSQMCVRAFGKCFTIPEGFTVGDLKGTDSTEPHPLAGQFMPITTEWLALLEGEDGDEDLVDAAAVYLSGRAATRTPAEQESFRTGDTPVADAGGGTERPGSARKKRAPVPTNSD